MSSDCCTVAEGGGGGIGDCPRCGGKGKPVLLATVGAIVKIEVEAVRLSAQTHRLCRHLICAAVYFARG